MTDSAAEACQSTQLHRQGQTEQTAVRRARALMMPVSTRPTGTVPMPPILYTSWSGRRRGLSLGRLGGSIRSSASSSVGPLYLRACHKAQSQPGSFCCSQHNRMRVTRGGVGGSAKLHASNRETTRRCHKRCTTNRTQQKKQMGPSPAQVGAALDHVVALEAGDGHEVDLRAKTAHSSIACKHATGPHRAVTLEM